ncbi:transporter substrate-binding domain-containing protein [Candidatus Babeliales bacterium]|nr:transporter substrate-binding domain-containing protein [Candidatus Babeliales bacterium]MBP9843320.1 transporter substrate-binding domain-containing protein [Candidatus Babeliales bacterium]
MKIKNLIIFCTIILTVFISNQLLQKQSVKNNEKAQSALIVGIAAGYAPFISINQQGDYEGFDIDVIKKLAQTIDKKLILKDLGSMTSLLMALEQGSIDAIIWGMSITQERLAKVAMVHYQGKNLKSYPLIFWKQIPAGVTKIEDMTDLMICFEPTSAQDTVLQKYPNLKLLPTEKIDDALFNIQYKKTVAALVEPAIAKKFKAQFPEIVTIDVPLKEQDQVQGCGIAIKKNNIDLIKEIEIGINKLKQNSFIAQAEITWGLADE